MVDLVGTGCAYRLTIHAVSAVAEFLYYSDPRALQGVVGDRFLEVIGALLGFVIDSAEGDPGLASRAVWTVQGLKFRLLGLGLDKECAAMFALCELDAFFAKCADFDDQEIQAQIDQFWLLDTLDVSPKDFRAVAEELDRRISESESVVKSERAMLQQPEDQPGPRTTPTHITFTYHPKPE
jgi:hypothetical protein